MLSSAPGVLGEITGSSPSTYSIPGSLGRLDSLGPPPAGGSNNPYAQTAEQLQFQDISHSLSVEASQYAPPDSAALLPQDGNADSAAQSNLPPSAIDPDAHLTASFYQIKYYQRFFDVTTSDMLVRLLKAALPFSWAAPGGGRFYAEEGMKPDLYGPFWITTTLIFLLAAAGNYANYLQFIGSKEKPHWNCDYQKVTTAASVFYFWITLFPTAIWCFMQRYNDHKGLVEVVSIFGYSLVTLLPVCLLSIPDINILRWLSLSISLFLSSVFLVRNLLHDTSNKALWPIMAFVLACNVGLATLTKFYFFD